MDECSAISEFMLFVGRTAILAAAGVSAYSLKTLISLAAGGMCFAFYSFCLLLTVIERQRDGLQLALIATLLMATIFCRVFGRIGNPANPGVRQENKAPMALMTVLLSVCAVVLGLIIISHPSEAACARTVRSEDLFRFRGTTSRQQMFDSMFGKNGTSWQLHEHIRKPRHREMSFSFELKGEDLQGKSLRKHLKEIADNYHIHGSN